MYPELVMQSIAAFPEEWKRSIDPCQCDEDTGIVLDSVLAEIDKMIRGRLALDLQEFEMPADLLHASDPNNKWRIVSTMQKAIRHGDVEMAMNCAHAGYLVDPRYTLRRLGICAIEDCGAGNLYGVASVMAAMGSKPWRDRVGDKRVVVYLAKLLAEGIKDRLACELCVMVDFDNDVEIERQEWAKLSDEALQEHARNTELDMCRRMTAAWLLAGTKKFWGMNVPADNDRPRFSLMRMMIEDGMPLIMYYIAEMVARRCFEGMFASLYLIDAMMRETAANDEPCEITEFEVPEVIKIGVLTSAGYDMHTREGKIALSKFVKENDEIRAFMQYVTDYEMRNLLIGCGVFCAEGGILAKRVSYPRAERIYEYAHRVELEYPGLAADQHQPFLDAIKRNLAHLNDCRRRVIWARNNS